MRGPKRVAQGLLLGGGLATGEHASDSVDERGDTGGEHTDDGLEEGCDGLDHDDDPFDEMKRHPTRRHEIQHYCLRTEMVIEQN